MLIPRDFPLRSLANDAEQQVVRAFRDRLNDSWMVIPDVGLRDERDYQLDVVLLNPDYGVLDIEVKGHRVELRDGVWCSGDRPLDPQPFDQARKNAYALRNRLRDACDLPKLRVDYGVAFPNTTSFSGRLPTDLERVQVLIGPDLEDPQRALADLMTARWGNTMLSRDDLEAIVSVLCPSLDFAWDAMAQVSSVRDRLDEICEDQIKVLQGLDVNRRVAVTGAAGTGKTRLASAWARRAFLRDERTLLTCYNEPLAAELRRRLPEDESLRIGAFLSLALSLDGMEPLSPPDDAGDEWWNVHAVGHLLRNWHQVSERYDTIIIDEAQDFSPAWISALETLLDPDGPRRVLLVADEQQILYERGFSTPVPADGWTRCELVSNCRNSFEIATLLRRHLGGAPAPVNRPGSLGVRWIEANGLDEAASAVRTELDRLLMVEGRDSSAVLVETSGSRTRRVLRDQLGLVRWEDKGPDSIVCENAHRAKGLEADSVIFVCPDADVVDTLLYVGISRAVSELVVVGPRELATRLGLA